MVDWDKADLVSNPTHILKQLIDCKMNVLVEEYMQRCILACILAGTATDPMIEKYNSFFKTP